jgi:DNA invertase Pin-like site-specific DNA recombinase
MVTKPDRLACSTSELLAIVADLSKRQIGLVILSLGGERLDTRNPTSKLMLTILRSWPAWRPGNGRSCWNANAKASPKPRARGIPRRPAGIDVAEIQRLRTTVGPAAIAKHLGIARSSVYRLLGSAARRNKVDGKASPMSVWQAGTM